MCDHTTTTFPLCVVQTCTVLIFQSALGAVRQKMVHTTILFCLCLWHLVGVFGVETNEVKSVSVKKGDFIILRSDVNGIHTYDKIEWRFVQLRIARIKKAIGNNPQYDNHERFRDRLKLDQTGSLTITDTRTTDSGVYQLRITIKNQETIKKFNVTVYGK
uniref:Immunoglobulin domain-containing protein n=1 Tax=Cyprinus carpio TaxID=7962 RepID=A0A8C2D5E0_CYPCA